MKKLIIALCILLALPLSACGTKKTEAEAEKQDASAELDSEYLVNDTSEITFSFTDGSESLEFSSFDLDGNEVNSKDVFAAADVTMVNIWGTFCSPCIAEMPDLGELSKEYADRGFQILGVVFDATEIGSSTVKDAKEIIEGTGADYTHVILNDELAKLMGSDVFAIPSTLFVDKDGRILTSMILGSNSKERWEGAVDKVLEKAKAE